MKKVNKVIIRLFVNVVFLLGTVSLAFAGGDVPNIKIVKSGLAKLSLIMNDISLATEATVSIEDKNGYVLLSEEVKKTSSFAKVFNLENLPAGNYKVVVNTQTRKMTQPLTLSTKDIEIDVKKRTVIFHPVIRKKDSFLDISWLGNRIASVKVSILSEAGDLVFEDNIKSVLKVEKRYNVAQLGNGNYTVKVKTPNDTYYQNLIIK